MCSYFKRFHSAAAGALTVLSPLADAHCSLIGPVYARAFSARFYECQHVHGSTCPQSVRVSRVISLAVRVSFANAIG